MLGEAQMRQKGKSDAGCQRVPVQPRPGLALEAAETQLLLELLVRLLAHPACLDGACQRAQRRATRQVAEIS